MTTLPQPTPGSSARDAGFTRHSGRNGGPITTPYHPPVKRSVEIAGHKTSISLEPLFWDLLREAAAREGQPINALVARIDAERIACPTPPGLAGAIRLWLAASLDREPER